MGKKRQQNQPPRDMKAIQSDYQAKALRLGQLQFLISMNQDERDATVAIMKDLNTEANLRQALDANKQKVELPKTDEPTEAVQNA